MSGCKLSVKRVWKEERGHQVSETVSLCTSGEVIAKQNSQKKKNEKKRREKKRKRRCKEGGGRLQMHALTYSRGGLCSTAISAVCRGRIDEICRLSVCG